MVRDYLTTPGARYRCSGDCAREVTEAPCARLPRQASKGEGYEGALIPSRLIIFCKPNRERPRISAARVWLPRVSSSAA